MKNVYQLIYNSAIYCGTYTNKEFAKQAREIIAKEKHISIGLIAIYKCPINKISYCSIKEEI